MLRGTTSVYGLARAQNSLHTTLSKKAKAFAIFPPRLSRNQAWVFA